MASGHFGEPHLQALRTSGDAWRETFTFAGTDDLIEQTDGSAALEQYRRLGFEVS